MDNWWDCSKIPYQDDNFQKILDFYLFGCPMRLPGKKDGQVSQHGKIFEERKIQKGSLKTLYALLKKHTASASIDCEGIKLNASERARSEDRIIQHINASQKSDTQFESLIFVVNPEIGVTKSIFYSIRNALAHGSFSVSGTGEKRTYCLENRKDGVLKARIRLREKTLLNWIELVEKPEPWKKQKSEKKNKKRMPALV